MIRSPDDPPVGGVPASIAAIMAAIRQEVTAHPAAGPKATQAPDPAAVPDVAAPAADVAAPAAEVAALPVATQAPSAAIAAAPATEAPSAIDPAVATGAKNVLPVAPPVRAADAAPARIEAGRDADVAAVPRNEAAKVTPDAGNVAGADAGAGAVAPPPQTDAEVRALLAPLLKSWLDAHLPEIVETAVHAEIRRLTGLA